MNSESWRTNWRTQETEENENKVRRVSKQSKKLDLKSSKTSRGASSREKTLRRLESNERERMRMHSLNDAFQVLLKTMKKFHILDDKFCIGVSFVQCFMDV